MRRRHSPLWLVGCLFLASCAADGGVVGSGLSALVTGNVTVVDTEPADMNEEMVPFTILVSVDEAPGVETLTDDQGNFELVGDFAGPVTIRFRDFDASEELGTLSLQVPSGTITTLSNIEIRPKQPPGSRIQPSVVRQFDFFGRLAEIECEADGTGFLRVDDDGPMHRQRFSVQLGEDTELTDDRGKTLICKDLRRGSDLIVNGVMLREGPIAATGIQVSDRRPPPPPMGQGVPVSVSGTITDLDCRHDRIEVEGMRGGERFRDRLHLRRESEIVCGEPPRRCGCPDLFVGDFVEGSGEQSPHNTSVIEVKRLTVRE